jgi:hypothetical protein
VPVFSCLLFHACLISEACVGIFITSLNRCCTLFSLLVSYKVSSAASDNSGAENFFEKFSIFLHYIE